jgi:hypothetical protein
LFLIVINFLCVNDGKIFIVFWFSKIVTTITTSRKLVRMGRIICLFVYYTKLIGVELLRAMEGATLKGSLEH